jgi:glycosyltransferase involved in cell wall biosynthesis
MTPRIFGALRVRNESRWIRRVIEAIQPVCNRIFVLDDRSDDDTADICESLGCTVFRSAVPWVNVGGREVSDESAGKEFLLERMYEAIPERHQHYANGNPESPFFCLSVDGDEELVQDDIPLLLDAIRRPGVHALSLRIIYLWDRPDQWRCDGVYGRFARPSVFRLMNRAFRYKRTPWGGGANFHCSSIPQELIHHSQNPQARCEARLLHWGYFDRDLRVKKYEFYNRIDGGNAAEDFYRHVVQGDIPEVPAHVKLKWAGPLELRPL